MISSITRTANSVKKLGIPLLSNVRYKAAYDGDGKTTVRVLNQEQDLGLMIDCYATYGFRLNNGLTVLGPIAIFPRTVLSWQITRAADITAESLRLFKLLEPKMDLLILGLDSKDRQVVASVFKATRANSLNVEILPIEHACSTFNFLNAEGSPILKYWLSVHDTAKSVASVFKATRANSLNVEILPIEHACSTFNFLNAEGRSVAAALIPPHCIELNENDMLQSRLHYDNLYEKELR